VDARRGKGTRALVKNAFQEAKRDRVVQLDSGEVTLSGTRSGNTYKKNLFRKTHRKQLSEVVKVQDV